MKMNMISLTPFHICFVMLFLHCFHNHRLIASLQAELAAAYSEVASARRDVSATARAALTLASASSGSGSGTGAGVGVTCGAGASAGAVDVTAELRARLASAESMTAAAMTQVEQLLTTQDRLSAETEAARVRKYLHA